MSDDVFSVATAFEDVASLAQGYMNRADGERLLLPLPDACKQGAGVRFVVYLEDGTPAFAGAGLCAQVSDQGSTVPPEQRYETLLDTLQFDERSRPVYDYIVAVRSAAYAGQGAAAEGELVDAELEPEHEAEELTVVAPRGVQAELLAGEDAGAEAELQPEPDAEAQAEPTSSWSQPVEWSQQAQWSTPAPADGSAQSSGGIAPALRGGSMSDGDIAPALRGSAMSDGGIAPAEAQQPPPAEPAQQPWMALDAAAPSFIPPPLPTGLLTRPARTTHWQPSPPRRPTPRPATGLFRYTAGGLPRPARPPYPDLDRSAWVQPAPRPAS